MVLDANAVSVYRHDLRTHVDDVPVGRQECHRPRRGLVLRDVEDLERERSRSRTSDGGGRGLVDVRAGRLDVVLPGAYSKVSVGTRNIWGPSTGGGVHGRDSSASGGAHGVGSRGWGVSPLFSLSCPLFPRRRLGSGLPCTPPPTSSRPF